MHARAGHYYSTVVSQLPLRAAADGDATIVAMADSMRPVLSTHVFVSRVHETIEGFTPENRPDDEPINLLAGSSSLIQYRLIRSLLLEGKLQLH